MSTPAWTERNAGRAYVPSKRVKAAGRRLGPPHPGHGSLKHFARWMACRDNQACQSWLQNKGCR